MKNLSPRRTHPGGAKSREGAIEVKEKFASSSQATGTRVYKEKVKYSDVSTYPSCKTFTGLPKILFLL